MGNLNSKTRWALSAAILAILLATAAVAAQPTLMAAFFVKGKVGLKWGKVSGASEYLVFRKDSSGEFTQIATTDKDKYFDDTVEGGNTYVYKIAIVDGGSNVFSGTKSVTIPGSTGDFKAPIWVGVRVDQDKLFLNWDPVPGAVAYNIWRSETAGSGYEVVGTAQGSRHVEKDGLVKGTTYYYVLSAMNQEFDETPMSKEQSIKYGISVAEQEAIIAAENHVELIPVKMTPAFEISTGPDGAVLNQPSDIFVNSKGMIYLCDTLNGQINCYDGGGTLKFTFGDLVQKSKSDYSNGTFVAPFTLFIDGKDQVYVTDVGRNDIQVFAADGSFIRRITVDVGEGMNPLRPNGLVVLDDGRMVMTDTGNHRFLVTDANGKIQMASGVRGTEEGQFIFPDELTVSKDLNVYIVGPINCRIQQFSLDGSFVRSFGSVGQSAGAFGRPKGITVGPKGLIWVTDGMSNMIQAFTADGEIKSAIGSVEDDFRFMTPRGVTFHDGQMFVVQRLHHKATVYNIAP